VRNEIACPFGVNINPIPSFGRAKPVSVCLSSFGHGFCPFLCLSLLLTRVSLPYSALSTGSVPFLFQAHKGIRLGSTLCNSNQMESQINQAISSAYLFVSFVQLSQIMIPSPPHHLYNPSLMNSPMSCAGRCQGKILSRGKVLTVPVKGKDNITKMLFDLYDMRMVFFDFTGSVRL
jgi:hypothetical protein